MEIFKYNSEKLIFERTNKLLKYRIIIAVLLLCFGGTLISAMKYKAEIGKKELTIKQKEERLRLIKEPLREEYYVQDLYKAIGFKLNKQQFNKFSELALKYKDQIEEAKVPATLVWYIAYQESRFVTQAKNNDSSASGLFQILKGTWNEVCKMKGYNFEGRFNEQKQVTVVLDYLNYLYSKNGTWEKVSHDYQGGEIHYNVGFLFK